MSILELGLGPILQICRPRVPALYARAIELVSATPRKSFRHRDFREKVTFVSYNGSTILLDWPPCVTMFRLTGLLLYFDNGALLKAAFSSLHMYVEHTEATTRESILQNVS
jgi:hypothetical protein